MPSSKVAIRKVEVLAEKYILLDLLLFKIISTPDKETEVLAIPERCIHKIITLYHLSLFAGHLYLCWNSTGANKTTAN